MDGGNVIKAVFMVFRSVLEINFPNYFTDSEVLYTVFGYYRPFWPTYKIEKTNIAVFDYKFIKTRLVLSSSLFIKK